MTETRERFCPHCGRANPVTMPRCMNCGQRVGGTVLLTEKEEVTTAHSPWWQTSGDSTIPPPPQVREQIARQEAALREKERLIEEQKRFHEKLEEERQRSSERLAAIRERRQERVEEKVTTQTAGTGTTLTNCRKCNAPLGQAGHTFSFCLHCGADTNENIKTTASAQPKSSTARPVEQTTQNQHTAGQTTASVRVTMQAERTRSEVNPVIPAIFSFIFPGVGQFINGQPTKGVVLLLALFVAMVIFKVGGLLLLVGKGLAALDAYTIAKRRRNGLVVREDEWDFGG